MDNKNPTPPDQTPDPLQQAWQSQSSGQRLTFDSELLSKEVLRSQQEFRSTIFWRDFMEVGVALLLIPIWFIMGASISVPWTFYLSVPGLLWVAGFILVDRKRHPKHPCEPGEPLLVSAKESLSQVEHQIWLLRNILWWYLLPLTIPILIFFLDVSWRKSGDLLERVAFGGFLVLFLVVIHGAIYYLNQRAVHKELEPRQQNLLKLIASLAGEGDGEDVGDLSELIAAIAKPARNAGLNTDWANNWNRIVPSWRVAAAILLPTFLGGLAGALFGLWYPVPEMGPVLFQSVVAAVIPFELALLWAWLRLHKRTRAAESSDGESPESTAADTSQDSTDHSSHWLPRTPALVVLVLTVFLGIMAFVALYAFVDAMPRDEEPAKLSPFSAVRWQGPYPEVVVQGVLDEGDYHKLVSIDGLPIAEIIVFSKGLHEKRWQQRFEEDLVELLTGMGHPPGETVTLEVQSLSTGKNQVLEDVPMTDENRKILKAYRERNNLNP